MDYEHNYKPNSDANPTVYQMWQLFCMTIDGYSDDFYNSLPEHLKKLLVKKDGDTK